MRIKAIGTLVVLVAALSAAGCGAERLPVANPDAIPSTTTEPVVPTTTIGTDPSSDSSAATTDVAPDPTFVGSPGAPRLERDGQGLYLHGANLPWYDFGCGPDRGVSSEATRAQIEPALIAAKEAGLGLVRW
jgi:hypothetical protein